MSMNLVCRFRARCTLGLIVLSIVAVFGVGVPAVPAGSSGDRWSEPQPDADGLDIRLNGKRISLHAEKIPLSQILRVLSSKTGVSLSIDGESDPLIRVQMNDSTLDEILRQICRNRALVYEYDRKTKVYRIVRAGAYGVQTGSRRRPHLSAAASNSALNAHRSKVSPASPGTRSVHGRMDLMDAQGRKRYKIGEILVKFKTGVAESQRHQLHLQIGGQVIGRMPGVQLEKIKLPEGCDEAEGIRRYEASGMVVYAERHALRYPTQTIPNDTLYNSQWALETIQAPNAWDLTRGGQEVVIAVVDTGVAHEHPDLAENIWRNADESVGDANGDGAPGIGGVDDDGDELVDEDSSGIQPGEPGYSNDLKNDDDENGFVDDIMGWDFADNDADPVDPVGHGTHVAGIIASRGNNERGVTGLCWEAGLMVLKIQSDAGLYMETWDIVAALDYALENGARIVNCSFGGELFEQSEFEALQRLQNSGVLAVCAGGNEGLNLDDPRNTNFPAGYDLDNIISVAASGPDDGLCDFSNFGAQTVHLGAPGVDIESTTVLSSATEAFVRVAGSDSAVSFAAIGMEYAGLTDENGITGNLIFCGLGQLETDFPTSVRDHIALIERGENYFYEKTANAMAAGASAVVIYNNVVDDLDRYGGTMESPGNWIPAVSISLADGQALRTLVKEGDVTITVLNYPAGEYEAMEGTSMAAPFVTGAAGLVLSAFPRYDYTGLKAAVLDSVDKSEGLESCVLTGGRLNAWKALMHPARTGDLSMDYRIRIDDVVIALQAVSGYSVDLSRPDWQPNAADINGDNRVGMEEAVYIMNVLTETR